MEDILDVVSGSPLALKQAPAVPARTFHGFAYEPCLVKVKELLAKKNIQIPYYQRPYKWTSQNVNQLLDDILLHRKRSAYRLGTIVMHQEAGQNVLHIVDGQQRCITLTLIALAIHDTQKELLKKISKEENLPAYRPQLASLQFTDRLSQRNIQQNYNEIRRRVREFDQEAVRFFYYHCELVEVVIRNISEAFQFFDSQNARGRDLEPHDLLKAFHLREMAQSATEQEKLESVAAWEAMDTDHLTRLFGNYLYRVRKWSKGYSARYFTKNEVGVFKGISPQGSEVFPLAALHRIGHFYIDAYNKEYHRQIDGAVMPYPFQLDGVLMNGKRFFELVSHYQVLLKQMKGLQQQLKESKDSNAYQILKTLDSYPSRDRLGDKYVRNLFDCCLLYYLDKFGTAEVGRAIEKFFIWAYSLRLQQYSVRLASMDNHTKESTRLFKIMREALRPADILGISLTPPKEVKATQVKEIEDLFRLLHYLP
ncbi:hypothetical protein ABID22_000335 [Pontibacter aydingkolensis]|uniref:DUF262 domain-containing protein n=1 Tax=Pontibacter aydingkolensis TaxID=1911536 RepID=A0ABS7CQA1_9BACT|nr:DUF262 domain-containing protein [Pontibacter aydingkolensis]MBW7466000.1 DUF262 domain-containing protein [Pontibacter aydingkolensis]